MNDLICRDVEILIGAADDTAALIMVTEVLNNRCNLLDYINRFGYVPKYGKPKNKIDKINYFPQNRR